MKGSVAMIQNGIVIVKNQFESHSYSTSYDESMIGLAVGDSVTFDVVKNKYGVEVAANIRKTSN